MRRFVSSSNKYLYFPGTRAAADLTLAGIPNWDCLCRLQSEANAMVDTLLTVTVTVTSASTWRHSASVQTTLKLM